MVKVVSPNLHKGEPYAPLLEKKTRGSGRNNNPHHRPSSWRWSQHYRVVDFRRDKDGIPAKVERLEYDPNRTAHIALLCYADGERRYIIAPRGLEVGATLVSGIEAPIRAGNTLPIRNIPVGTTIHCVEMIPGKVLRWSVRPALPPSCWPAKARTPRFVCARVKCAACTSSAAPPSVKSVTKNTACARSARPVQCVGAVSARRFVAWP